MRKLCMTVEAQVQKDRSPCTVSFAWWRSTFPFAPAEFLEADTARDWIGKTVDWKSRCILALGLFANTGHIQFGFLESKGAKQ